MLTLNLPRKAGALIAALLVLGVPASAQRRRQQSPNQPVSIDPAEAAAGAKLYQSNCTICHGAEGEPGDRGPALAGQRRYLRSTEEDLFDAIKNGIAGTLMPSSPLAAANVRKIVAYIRSLRATAVDVAVPGDAAKGAQIFHGKGGCTQCHTIAGRGGLLGPDLSNIGGERKLDLLRDALTKEKPAPPRGYQPVSLTTASGQSIRGLVKNENNFSLQVLGADGRLYLLDRGEVRELRYDPKSLMPAGIDKKLTRDEFQDLLAFLSRQARERQP